MNTPPQRNHVLRLLMFPPEKEHDWSCQSVQFNNFPERCYGDPDDIPTGTKSFLPFCILAIHTAIRQINSGGSTDRISRLTGLLQENIRQLFGVNKSAKWLNRIFGDDPFGPYLCREGSIKAGTFSVVFQSEISIEVCVEGGDGATTDVTLLKTMLDSLRRQQERNPEPYLVRIFRMNASSIEGSSRSGFLKNGDHFRVEVLQTRHANTCVFWIDNMADHSYSLTELHPSLEVDIRTPEDTLEPAEYSTFIENGYTAIRIPEECRLRVNQAEGCASVIVLVKGQRFTTAEKSGVKASIQSTLPLRSLGLFISRPHFRTYSLTSKRNNTTGISGPSTSLDWDQTLVSALRNQAAELLVFHIPVM